MTSLRSAAAEAVWAVALGRSEGFTRLGPTLTFAVALAALTGNPVAIPENATMAQQQLAHDEVALANVLAYNDYAAASDDDTSATPASDDDPAEDHGPTGPAAGNEPPAAEPSSISIVLSGAAVGTDAGFSGSLDAE